MNDWPEPIEDDRRRARLLVEGAGGAFPQDSVEFWAQGIAVARTGGDVRAWLREQAATAAAIHLETYRRG